MVIPQKRGQLVRDRSQEYKRKIKLTTHGNGSQQRRSACCIFSVMKATNDGNTGNREFVYIKDGVQQFSVNQGN